MRRNLTLSFAFVFLALSARADDPRVELRRLAGGLDLPVSITHAGDARLFVTQQRGRIAIIDGATLLPTPFLNVSSLVSCCNERGLLSVAFHPHYRDNGFFFIDYTDVNGNTVVARYQVSASDPNVADPNSAKILLQIQQPFANHNGGQLQFGPDGYLYIGMGDGGSGGDPGNRAQNLGELLGKLLRIDVDSGSPYGIPPSNPFVSHAGARGEIWAYGLRNPWRFTFDRETGDMLMADVGQGSWEEVDFQPVTSIGGENYGWRRMEGTHCYNPSTNCSDATFTMPILEYGHTNGACSITGGYRYRGSNFPRLRGMYIFGDYCNGIIQGATLSGTTWTARTLIDTPYSISTFGEDVNGELYVADYAGGVIYQLIDANPVTKRRSVAH